jgi:hypothetical protein
MPSSNYLRGKVIDGSLRNINYTAPTTVFVSLHSSDPTANATPASEVAGTWYTRQTVVFGAQSIAGQTANTNTITYNAVVNGPVTVTHFAVWDAQTLGNMLYFGPLAATKTFSDTDVPSWLAGQIAIAAA